MPSPGVLTTSAGYCFIEFDSHQLASMSFALLSGAVVNGKELKVGSRTRGEDEELPAEILESKKTVLSKVRGRKGRE